MKVTPVLELEEDVLLEWGQTLRCLRKWSSYLILENNEEEKMNACWWKQADCWSCPVSQWTLQMAKVKQAGLRMNSFRYLSSFSHPGFCTCRSSAYAGVCWLYGFNAVFLTQTFIDILFWKIFKWSFYPVDLDLWTHELSFLDSADPLSFTAKFVGSGEVSWWFMRKFYLLCECLCVSVCAVRLSHTSQHLSLTKTENTPPCLTI